MKKVVITTPYPSVETVARELGVSKTRLRQIKKIAASVLAERTKDHRRPLAAVNRAQARGKSKAAQAR